MGKFDSEYSALKALALSIGCITPENGWDSSYSIISSMYTTLTGTEPAAGESPLDMLTTIQEGVESGDIELGDECITEINRLNEVIRNLNKEIEDLKNSGAGEECTAEINRLNEVIGGLNGEIEDLNKEIEELKNSGSSIDFSSIGYDAADSALVNEEFNHDIQRSQELLAYWESNTSLHYNTTGFKDIVYSPKFDFTGKRITSLFYGCSSLKIVPLLNTSSETNMSQVFYECSSLKSIPLLDTSSATDMHGMFYNCTSLKTVPLLDTSSVKNMNELFKYCASLKTVPLLDTSSVTDMGIMFNGCTSLETIPLLNTSSVKNMTYMFYDCTSLETLPSLDTSSVTSMNWMFSGCINLESLPLLDFSSVTSIRTFFGYNEMTNLTDLGGFTGLKINWTSALDMCPNLTRQSLLNVFNTIADVRDLGGRTLTIGNTNLGKLSDEDKLIATNKGWTLS